MPIYSVSTNPRNIPGLSLWIDASDESTIGETRVTIGSFSYVGQSSFTLGTIGQQLSMNQVGTAYGQLSRSYNAMTFIRDKVNNITFTCDYYTGLYGTQAFNPPMNRGTDSHTQSVVFPSKKPIYSRNSINGKNSILFHRTDVTDARFGATGISAFNSPTYSLYCVFVPAYMTWSSDGLATRSQYVISVFDSQRIQDTVIPGMTFSYGFTGSQRNFPNIAVISNYGTFSGGRQIVNNNTINDASPSWNSVLTTMPGSNYEVNILGNRIVGNTQSNISSWNFITGDERFRYYGISGSGFRSGTASAIGRSMSSAAMTIGGWFPGLNDWNIGDDFGTSLGENGTGGRFLGYFCEMLYYNRYLTDNENQRVLQYLKNKWYTNIVPTFSIAIWQRFWRSDPRSGWAPAPIQQGPIGRGLPISAVDANHRTSFARANIASTNRNSNANQGISGRWSYFTNNTTNISPALNDVWSVPIQYCEVAIEPYLGQFAWTTQANGSSGEKRGTFSRGLGMYFGGGNSFTSAARLGALFPIGTPGGLYTSYVAPWQVGVVTTLQVQSIFPVNTSPASDQAGRTWSGFITFRLGNKECF